MIKRAIRLSIALGCRGTNWLACAERLSRQRLSILCYHRVLPANRKAACLLPDLAVTPEAFRKHCRTLARHFAVLPLTEAVERWTSGQPPRRPLAAITFDDGYRDNLEYAAPVLADTGLRATFFVVAGLVGTNEIPWYDRMGRAVLELQQKGPAAELLAGTGLFPDADERTHADATGITPQQVVGMAKTLPPDKREALLEALCAEAGLNSFSPSQDLIMDWGRLGALVDAGHEIGSHSATHEILPLLNDIALEAEVAESRRVLERGLGVPIRAFCYPNGDFDDRTLRAVEVAGYTCAVTVEPGCNEPDQHPFRLKRWFMHEDRLAGPRGKPSATLLRMELCGLADRLFARHPHRETRV